MSSYFSLPSFARAKKNKEQLEKSNPQNPVLNDEDEQFLNKQIESGQASEAAKDAPPTKITESGEEKEASKEEVEQAAPMSPDQVAVPEEQSKAGDGASESNAEEPKEEEAQEEKATEQEPEEAEVEAPKAEESKAEEPNEEGSKAEDPASEEPKAEEAKQEDTKAEDSHEEPKPEEAKPEDAPQESAEDPPEQAPDDSIAKAEAPAAKPKKDKKSKDSFDLPSQEEAEAATRGFNVGGDKPDKTQGELGEKRTWASYLPSVGGKKDQSADQKPAEAPKDGESADKRTWADYASSAYSSLPSIPSLPTGWMSKDKDSKSEPVYNEDGTINEEKTKEKQEQEVSVLLDNLNMSSINNRVFAFSGETQKIYERFAQVLKDTMNGGPTAYEDMEKLMKDAGPELEKQFASMPPFVQTLVKSLPAKLGTSLGPELLAAASEKPGGDMKARMAAASKQPSGGDPSIQTASSSSAPAEEATEKDGQKKQKRRIPGLKGLVSEQGMVASILRNTVNFLRVRFPFLASMSNVVMSLAVFSKSSADS